MESESYAAAEGAEAGAHPALSRRLEALVEDAASESGPELPVGPVLAVSMTGLRADLGAVSAEISALRAEQARRTDEGLGERIESLAAEVRALRTESARPADDTVEERLAAIEDTLDGLAERLEALARDSASDAGERIASLDDRLAALSQSVAAERTASAQHRERTALAMQDQAAALDEWAEAVRAGLEDLGEAMTGSLSSLGSSLQNPAARDADRRHVEALITELSTTIDEAFAGMSEQITAQQLPVSDKLAAVHEDVLDGFGGARARLVEELGGLLSRLESANVATRQLVETELTELRGDLADALEEVREGVEGTVGGANESIAATLEEHRAASEELRDGIAAAAHHSQDSGKRIRGLQDTVGRLDATLADLQGDWRPRVDAVVAEGRASAQSVLEQMQAEVDDTMTAMRQQLEKQAGSLRDVTGVLGGGTERLISAGQSLLAYLGERDRWLERERDRVLHEILDEFAEGLSAKERKAVASRVGEALDRRRDARDAERFRRSKSGQPAVEIPPVPAEVAELAEPVEPIAAVPTRGRSTSTAVRSTSTPRRPAKRTVSTAAVKKTAAKSPARSTTAARVSKTAAKKTAAAKTPSKSTRKSTARATPTKRQTGS